MKSLYITLIVVILDQITKIYIKGISIPALGINHSGMAHGQSVPVWGDFFRITYVENPGMAFGIELTIATKIMLCLFSLVACLGLLYYLFTVRKQSLSLRVALAFILAGAIGNLIDRMFYGLFYGYGPLFHGRVVDFLDFEFFDLTLFGRMYERFPIFNVADTAVNIGVGILLLFYKKHQNEAAAIDEEKAAAAIGPAESESAELVTETAEGGHPHAGEGTDNGSFSENSAPDAGGDKEQIQPEGKDGQPDNREGL